MMTKIAAGITARITTSEPSVQRIERTALAIDQASSRSTASTSRENRFRMRPTGVASKKRIRVPSTPLSAASWMSRPAAMARNAQKRCCPKMSTTDERPMTA